MIEPDIVKIIFRFILVDKDNVWNMRFERSHSFRRNVFHEENTVQFRTDDFLQNLRVVQFFERLDDSNGGVPAFASVFHGDENVNKERVRILVSCIRKDAAEAVLMLFAYGDLILERSHSVIDFAPRFFTYIEIRVA